MSEMSVLLASTFIGMLHSLGDRVQNRGQKERGDLRREVGWTRREGRKMREW